MVFIWHLCTSYDFLVRNFDFVFVSVYGTSNYEGFIIIFNENTLLRYLLKKEGVKT